MSAKEDMVVQIEAAKEKADEVIASMREVLNTIEATQGTVTTVMGEPDEHFAQAAEMLETIEQGTAQLIDTMNNAIAAVNQAGQGTTLS